MLRGAKPARFRNVVQQQMGFESGDLGSPGELLQVMEVQLEKNEAAEDSMRFRVMDGFSGKAR